MKIIYVLTEEGSGRYSAMTRVSVASLRVSNPHARVEVACDRHTDADSLRSSDTLRKEVDAWTVWDTPEGSPSYRNRHIKTRLRHLFKGPFLYIDADTFVRGDLSEIFALDTDVALARNHSADRIDDQVWDEDADTSRAMGWHVGDVPYLNGGVIFYADTEGARAWSTRWHEEWLACVTKTGRANDQPALNHALREIDPRLHILAHRFNAQFHANLAVSCGAVVLHSYASGPTLPSAAELLAERVERGGCLERIEVEDLVRQEHPWKRGSWVDDWVARRASKKSGLDEAYRLWFSGRRAASLRSWLLQRARALHGRDTP